MNIVAYVDESGTSDRKGLEPGSEIAVFAGFVATAHYWHGFRKRWARTLSNYRSACFHFSEFASKRLNARPLGKYYGWSEKKKEKYLYDLAVVASERAIPIGGLYDVKENFRLGNQHNPYQAALEMLFQDLGEALHLCFPGNEKALIIIDNHESEKWRSALSEVHVYYAKHNPRIGALLFRNDTDDEGIPLQAVDLYAYLCRQRSDTFKQTGKLPPLRVLDFLLCKNSPGSEFRHWPDSHWKFVVRAILKDMREKKLNWAKNGDPGRVYYPALDYPFQRKSY